MKGPTGWDFSQANNRLEMRFKSVLIAYINASGMFLADDTPVGGGGDIPDPLELGAAVFTGYVAVGTDPATAGAVRLGKDDYITSDRVTGVANVRLLGWDSGLSYVSIDPDGRGAIFGDEIHIANDVWIMGRNGDDDDDIRILKIDGASINIGDALLVDPSSGVTTGTFISSNHLLPFTDSSLNHGATDKKWANVYTVNLNVTNIVADLQILNPGAGGGLWVDEADGFAVKQGHA